MSVKKLYKITWRTGPIKVRSRSTPTFLESESARVNVYSVHTGVPSPKSSFSRLGWRKSIHHLLGKQWSRESKNKRLRASETHDRAHVRSALNTMNTMRRANAKPCPGDIAVFVRMCWSRSRVSLMLRRPSKHSEASKLRRIQREATLWHEMTPKVSRTAAWSAYSLPKFPLRPYTCCMVSRSLCWTRIIDCWQANASCTCVRAWIVPRQIPAACMESLINTWPFITSDRVMRIKEGQCFKHDSHFSDVVGVSSGIREGQVGLGSDDRTKHDVNLSMRGSGNHTPSSKDFTIHNASTIKKNSLPMIVIVKFLRKENDHWEEKDTWTWDWENGKSGAGRQESASQDKLSGTRGRGQEWWRSWIELFLSDNHQNSQRLQNQGGVYDGDRQMRQGSLEPQYHIEGSAGTLGRSSRLTGNFLVAKS